MTNLRIAAAAVLAFGLATGAQAGEAPIENGKPAYCSGAGAYRLPECGLTERQAREAEAAAAAARTRSHPDKHTRIQPIAEPAEKVLAREQLRIYDNCMATDKTMVQCGKRAGFVD